MTVLARVASVLKHRHETFARWSLRRPGRTVRLFALSILLVCLYALPEAAGWHDYLWATWSLLLTGFVAIAPRGFYDGRFERWTREHEGLASVLTAGFVVFLGLLFLSDLFAVRTSLLIAAPLGLVLGVSSRLSGRRRHRNVDEGSASDVDGEPSSR